MTAIEYFRLLATEFATVPDLTVETWLTMTLNVIDVSCLDAERAAMAQALYAAHWLKLSSASTSGFVGVVTSEKEGDLQRTYSAVANSNTLIGITSYGQQYLEITKACAGAGIMTRFS